jgi:hypothetical protein
MQRCIVANTLRKAGVDLDVEFNKRTCFKEWTFKSSESTCAASRLPSTSQPPRIAYKRFALVQVKLNALPVFAGMGTHIP